MRYVDSLPPMCPPSDAVDQALTLYRLVPHNPAIPANFASYLGGGVECPSHIDPCRWASCSLVVDPAKQKRLPKFKNYKWAAHLSIPRGSGKAKKTSGNHYDFWCYSSFNMISSVVEIVGI